MGCDDDSFHRHTRVFYHYLLLWKVGAASLLADRQQVNSLFVTNPSDPSSLDRAAKMYRNAAALYDANCTWDANI